MYENIIRAMEKNGLRKIALIFLSMMFLAARTAASGMLASYAADALSPSSCYGECGDGPLSDPVLNLASAVMCVPLSADRTFFSDDVCVFSRVFLAPAVAEPKLSFLSGIPWFLHSDKFTKSVVLITSVF